MAVRQLIITILGIMLLYGGLCGRREVFYHIRGIPVKGIGAVILRIIYIAAGAALIIMTFSGRI